MNKVILGGYVKIKTGKLDANASEENGKYPFFTCAREISRINTYAFDCECVLVAGNGELNVKYYEGKFNAYQRTYVIESLDHQVLSTKYLYYFIDSYMEKLRNGAIGGVIKYIKLNHLTDIELPLPDLETQDKIVAILDKAKSLIDKREQTIKMFDELLRATFLDMFGDPILNTKGWEVDLFQKVAKNENSKRVPIKQADRDKREGDYPYYGATGIIDNIDDYKFDGDYLLIAEDGMNLLYNRKNNAFLASGKFWVNNHAHILSYNGKCSLKYLLFFLNLIDLKPYITGIDQVKLNKSNLEKIIVPIPSIELQNKFEKAYLKYEEIKKKVIKSKNQLEYLLNSLSQSAFNGDLEFNTAVDLEVLLENDYEYFKDNADKKAIQLLLDRLDKNELNENKFYEEHLYDKAKSFVFELLKEEKIKQVYEKKQLKLVVI